jgi:hypothetical protein
LGKREVFEEGGYRVGDSGDVCPETVNSAEDGKGGV